MSTESEKTGPRKGAGRKSTWTPEEISKATAMYSSGEFTYEEIGKHLDRNPLSVKDKMNALGVKKGEARAIERQAVERVQERLAEQALDSATIISQRLKETQDFHYNISNLLGKVVAKEVKAMLEAGGQSIASKLPTFKSLESAAKVLQTIRQEKYAALGFDPTRTSVSGEDIEELVVQELTADQIAEMRAAQTQSEDFLDMED